MNSVIGYYYENPGYRDILLRIKKNENKFILFAYSKLIRKKVLDEK